MKESKPKEAIRNKTIHIAFSEREINEIDKHCMHGTLKITTRTEFIRQAIFDKIRNIENPEVNTINNPKNYVQVIDFLKDITKKLEHQEKVNRIIEQKLTTINGIKNGYKSLKELISDKTIKENLKLKTEKIQSVMKESNKAFTPKEIKDITGFDLKSIDLSFTSNPKLFKININGRWVLRE